jgi:hypothetical protein
VWVPPMRHAPADLTVSGMVSSTPLEVTVQLDRRESPISGVVRQTGKPACSFVGWVGLLAALEEAFDTESLDCSATASATAREKTAGAS